MIASLRWERGIIWDDLDEDDKISAYAWWVVRGKHGQREC